MNYWPGAAVPVGGGGAWPGSEPTRRASRLAARTASGRAAAHGRTKQPGPTMPPLREEPYHTTPLQLGALEAEDVKELARAIR